MSSNMNAKPSINPANQKTNKEKKEHRLVVAPPTLRPGGVMPPPQSKNGQDGTGATTEEFTFNSLVSSISSLSPWAEPPAAAEGDSEEVGQVVRPEDALEFFQKQTMNMDKEALLARVAEAAAREADAVTKLGQLTFKLAAKEKLMDDLRAGLVSAGRAVTEAQQEADEVKRQVAQQESALAAKYGTTIDVLKRLGEVTAKCDQKEAALEQTKSELAAAKRMKDGLDSEFQQFKKEAAAREAELVSHMALAKKAAISREVELSTALAAAKAAAQKALAAASAARAVRTNEIIDVLSAKESQVEGLMTALDAVKVQNEIIEDEGIDEEDKEEIAEKDELIKNLLRDLISAIYGSAGAMAMYSVEEIEKLRQSVKESSTELEVMRQNINVTNYTVAQIEELKRDLAAREKELGITLASVAAGGGGGGGALSAAQLRELEQLRVALMARDKELATLRATIEKSAGQAKPESEISKLSKEDLVKSLTAMEAQLDSLRAELATARSSQKVVHLPAPAAESPKAAPTPKSGGKAGETVSSAELENALAAVASRDQLLENLKQDFNAARKALAQAEKDKEALKKELRDREAALQAEISGIKGSLRASEAAHQQQLSARESSTEGLRADLNAARRAIAAAEADIVATKKAAAAREAQLHAELQASKTSYEVLKLAAYAVKAQPEPGAGLGSQHSGTGANGNVVHVPQELLYRPGELSAQLAAREAHIESLKAELAAVRRAVQAAEEEAQARREAMAALEHDLGAELAAAKAAHEAAELAAAELATNAAANAQNASNMMSMLSEQLSQERELRRCVELELRAERDANPDRPRITIQEILAQEQAAMKRASKQGGGLGALLKSVVAGVAAGVATTVALGGSDMGKKAQAPKREPKGAAAAAPAAVAQVAEVAPAAAQ